MGRRVTSSTKGGRYMNPADQERKANRKRELKKNKKQRLLVRQAVLKSKDPQQIIEDMDKLDQMEFNPNETPPLSERVIQEKRGKLRETFTRVMGMYRRDNENEKFMEMKKLLQEYDRKRMQMEQHYVAVKFAREVDPIEIPLPDAAPPPPDAAAAMTPMIAALHHIHQGPFPPHLMLPGGMPPFGGMSNIPPSLLVSAKPPSHGILKKAKQKLALPPGVPLGLAPELSDEEDVEHHEDDELVEEGDAATPPRSKKKISTTEKSRVRFDAVAEEAEDLDAEKDSRSKYKELAKKLAAGEVVNVGNRNAEEGDEDDEVDESLGGATSAPSDAAVSHATAHPSMMRPPMPHLNVMGLPPFRPPMPHFGMPPRLRPGMRMPPMNPGFPPGNFQRPFIGPGHPQSMLNNSGSGAVLSAPPTITKPKNVGPVIEAKPQLRNMQHEITKLVPTAVKVRRETKASVGQISAANKQSKNSTLFRNLSSSQTSSQFQSSSKPKTTDDAYDQFMKEMHGLI